VRAGVVMTKTADPLVQELVATDYFQNNINNVAARVSCPWPSSLAEINKHKLVLKAGECNDRARCGAEEFRGDPIGKAWLQRPEVCREGENTEALKLRSNTTGVAANLYKLGKIHSVNCRSRNSRPETQAPKGSGGTTRSLLKLGIRSGTCPT
jgi:hypothetical protein